MRTTMDTPNEVERLRREIAQLKQQLNEKQTSITKPSDLTKDAGFVEDMARFSAGILTEAHLRMKYHLVDEAMWEQLGNDTALIERIQLEATRRLRSGATKRELAQNRIVAARHGGPKAIERVRRTQPAAYLKILALLVPREHKVQ